MVLYNQRSTPLALNTANTAFSSNINLAWDFTGHDAPRSGGVPWIYTGATAPTLVLTGTQTVTTVNGEPGIVAGASSLYQYTNTTDYGMQAGTGDFTIAIRVTTPATLPTTSNTRELMRVSGSAGNAMMVTLLENPNVGWYFSYVGSNSAPAGAVQTAVFYPANTTIMVWIRKLAGVVTFYTQNVTTQANTVLRNAAGAAATTPVDATWAGATRVNFGGAATTTPAMQALTRWSTGLSVASMDAIGKDFYETQANNAVADSIAVTSPTAGSSIPASSVISGTYVGAAPTGVQVQFGAGTWASGTGMTIGGGSWSGSFALTAGGPSTLQARETNAPAIVSPTVSNITVVANSIAFNGNGLTTDEAVPYRLFQRNASNQATVRIKGTYTGTPTSLQYSYNGGAWATLVASPTGGTFNAVVTLSGPSQGALSVRFSNDTSVVGTMSAVGVGEVIATPGQSQHVGGGAGTYVPPVAPGSNPSWKATILDKTGVWRENVETELDPYSKTTNASFNSSATATYAVQASSATATNSYFGKLATLYMAAGVPVAFVPSAMGSTTLEAWAPSTSTSTLYGAMRARALAVGFSNITFWQGEANCGNGTTRATHEANLNALVNAWKADFPSAKIYLMNINATGNSVGSGGTGASDTGFAAIHAAIAAVAASNANVTGYANMNGAFSSALHYSTAPEIDTIAARAYTAMNSSVVGADLVGSYGIDGFVAASLSGSYSISDLVSADLAGEYAIGENFTLVAADLVGNYAMKEYVNASLNGSFEIQGAGAMTFVPSTQRTVTIEPGVKPFTAGTLWNLTDPKKPKASKDSDSTLDYSFNWAPWLLDVSDTIASHEIILQEGLVDEGSVVVGGRVTVFVSAGTAGKRAAITCRITTASTPPRKEDRTIYLDIEAA